MLRPSDSMIVVATSGATLGPAPDAAREGAPPVPELVISPRAPKGPRRIELPVAAALLAAGDHNGSTFYQHERFLAVVRGQASPEVTLGDGARAVAMGLAAQQSAMTGQAVEL